MSDAASATDRLAKLYTAAWCSQNANSVATFYSPNGSLRINNGSPAIGRDAIAQAAQAFMTAFPDMKVVMDCLSLDGDCATYCWTLIGTNTGPGGTGKSIQISGFEEWRLSDDGLILESHGHFDNDEYDRQLR